jgi:integrase
MQWHKTDFKGVRFRKHPTRKHGVGFDKYYTITYKLDGKTKSEALGWATESVKPSDCFDALCRLKNNWKNGGPRTLAEEKLQHDHQRIEKDKKNRRDAKRHISFKAFFEDIYQPDAEISKKAETFRKEKEHLNNWIHPVTGSVPMRELDLVHIKNIKATLAKKKRSPRTLQYVFRTFTTVWNAALDAGYVSGPSPTTKKSFKLPKVSNEKDRYLTQAEANILLDAVKKESYQSYQMALLSLHSGMRFSEIARLTWGNIDMSNESIKVFGKADKERTIPMPGEIVALFTEATHGKPNELVFPNKFGKKHRQVPTPFKRAVKISGLNDGVAKRDNVGFHTLRHTRASWLVHAGVDLYRVQKILGHGTPIQTQRYAHLIADDLKEAIKLEEAHRKAQQGEKILQFPRSAEQE